MSWRDTWQPAPELEGARGSGERRGRAGHADFGGSLAGRRYPACSDHGAMLKLSPSGVWRCMVEGCNVGVQTPLSGSRA